MSAQLALRSPRLALQPQDYVLVYALCAVERYHEARELAEKFGPELFPPGPPRRLGVDLVLGHEPTLSPELPREFRREWEGLRESMAYSNLPNTPEWAMHSVYLLAEQRHTSILAQSLVWAAQEVRKGAPPARIRRDVEHAFDVAQGRDIATSAALLKGGA